MTRTPPEPESKQKLKFKKHFINDGIFIFKPILCNVIVNVVDAYETILLFSIFLSKKIIKIYL